LSKGKGLSSMNNEEREDDGRRVGVFLDRKEEEEEEKEEREEDAEYGGEGLSDPLRDEDGTDWGAVEEEERAIPTERGLGDEKEEDNT